MIKRAIKKADWIGYLRYKTNCGNGFIKAVDAVVRIFYIEHTSLFVAAVSAPGRLAPIFFDGHDLKEAARAACRGMMQFGFHNRANETYKLPHEVLTELDTFALEVEVEYWEDRAQRLAEDEHKQLTGLAKAENITVPSLRSLVSQKRTEHLQANEIGQNEYYFVDGKLVPKDPRQKPLPTGKMQTGVSVFSMLDGLVLA